MLFKKAKECGCDLVLPVDFVTANKINRDVVIGVVPAPAEERPTSRSAEENSGSNAKNVAKSGKTPAVVTEPVPEPVKEFVPTEESKMWLENPGMHWSDFVLKTDQANVVDLEEQILAKASGACVDKKSQMRDSSMATTSGVKTPE